MKNDSELLEFNIFLLQERNSLFYSPISFRFSISEINLFFFLFFKSDFYTYLIISVNASDSKVDENYESSVLWIHIRNIHALNFLTAKFKLHKLAAAGFYDLR